MVILDKWLILKDGMNSETYFNKLKNKKEQNAKKTR